MKLFVDDIRNAPDDKWHVARTITEAIRCIRYYRDEIEEISLDHDISHQVGMGELSRPYPCGETYAAVAYFIGEVYEDRANAKKAGVTITCLGLDCPERTGGECKLVRIPKIVIHSSNIIGVENIETVLAAYGIPSVIEMRGAANRLEMEV